ncbi:MAG TPA: DUF1460 domain-containing protein [Ignavibacteriaceae bacterium]|mgnify:CR=1 FL=1|nr:DUF1460 domain-containing protein [Ignavibacteriaceae bacterium]
MKLLLNLFFALNIIVSAQVFSDSDKEICSTKFQLILDKNLSTLPINDLVTEIGKTFINTEYIAHTLETEGDEKLVVNLSGLDCTTFLETAITFARTVKKGKYDLESYLDELKYIRYRNGNLDGYASRLHYFSDWIYNNVEKEIVKDITKEIGGKKISFDVWYMSKNFEAYRMLKANPKYIPIIQEQEKAIRSRTYYYIPKSEVNLFEDKIQNGDLIAITTNLKGLDISHVGIAVKMQNGRIHFMHAPLVGAKVQISPEPIQQYLEKIKKHTGIIVLRPLEP